MIIIIITNALGTSTDGLASITDDTAAAAKADVPTRSALFLEHFHLFISQRLLTMMVIGFLILLLLLMLLLAQCDTFSWIIPPTTTTKTSDHNISGTSQTKSQTKSAEKGTRVWIEPNNVYFTDWLLLLRALLLLIFMGGWHGTSFRHFGVAFTAEDYELCVCAAVSRANVRHFVAAAVFSIILAVSFEAAPAPPAAVKPASALKENWNAFFLLFCVTKTDNPFFFKLATHTFRQQKVLSHWPLSSHIWVIFREMAAIIFCFCQSHNFALHSSQRRISRCLCLCCTAGSRFYYLKRSAIKTNVHFIVSKVGSLFSQESSTYFVTPLFTPLQSV